MQTAQLVMANRTQEFTRKTKELALARQKNLCASCGTPITELGQNEQSLHKFGESVQAHHVKHVKLGGTNNISNCVVICWSCHYNVHEGGNYRFGFVSGTPEDFPHFSGVDQAGLKQL
jgi:5-methylcytosine-specific restriction endonuclease McrA